MKIYFTNGFISVIKDLIKSKHHANIEKIIIDNVLKKDFNSVRFLGSRILAGDNVNSLFIKKRIAELNKDKRGGYRLYAWLLIRQDNIYIVHIHPKTGKYGVDNISKKKKSELINTYKQAKKDNELIEVSLLNDKIINSKTKKQILG